MTTAAEDGKGSDRIRDIAVRHHHAMAGEFERRYAQMSEDRYASAFSYGRHKIDVLIEDELAALAAGSSVLDVGCGTGAYFAAIRRHGHVPSGVEPAEAMRTRAVEADGDAVVEDGLSSALPFSDASFDLVMAIEVYRYLDGSEVQASYAEALRVLKPGGLFFFTMVNRYALDGFWLLQRVRQSLAHGAATEEHPHCEFVTPDSVSADLRRAGFVQVEQAGRLFAPLRMLYKTAPSWAPRAVRRLEDLDDAVTSRPWMTAVAGHLICSARRPL